MAYVSKYFLGSLYTQFLWPTFPFETSSVGSLWPSGVFLKFQTVSRAHFTHSLNPALNSAGWSIKMTRGSLKTGCIANFRCGMASSGVRFQDVRLVERSYMDIVHVSSIALQHEYWGTVHIKQVCTCMQTCTHTRTYPFSQLLRAHISVFEPRVISFVRRGAP